MPADRTGMSAWQLALRSLAYYAWANLAVTAGAAIAVAVLAGSLLVGDSVRGSLRDIAVGKLGPVWYAVFAEGTVTEELSSRIGEQSWFKGHFRSAMPLLQASGSVHPAGSSVTIPGTNVIGVDAGFWRTLGAGEQPAGREVALNSQLAGELGVAAGDDVLVYVGRQGVAPAFSLFGRRDREDTVSGMRLRVKSVLEGGAGDFDLRATQQTPRNAFLPVALLQDELGVSGRVNTIAVSSGPQETASPARERELAAELAEKLQDVVTLDDYGLRLTPYTDHNYLSLQSRSFVLSGATASALRETLDAGSARMGMTSVYLANSIGLVADAEGKTVPYSVVLGVEDLAAAPLGPVSMRSGTDKLNAGEIILNAWTADDLDASVGNEVLLRYYVADDEGNTRETERSFRLVGIAPTDGPLVAPGIVPEFEGITNAQTIGDWDPPFPLDTTRIRPKDEAYWDEWRAAPKAFLSLDDVREMWQEGFSGEAAVDWRTSILIAPAGSMTLGDLQAQLREDLPRALAERGAGYRVQAVRADALKAAHGSTDFGMLFVSMSFFLVAASAALVGLLFRLNVERRASQYGLMTAVGIEPPRALGILRREGLLLAVAGTCLGVVGGVVYAWALIRALSGWWGGAVAEINLSLHVGAFSLAIGMVLGFGVSISAISWAGRILKKARPLDLLAGWRFIETITMHGRGRAFMLSGLALILAGIILLGTALATEAVPETGAFFGGGGALLLGSLALTGAALGPKREHPAGELSAWNLAWRSASRNRARSLLTVGLLACASFVIVTVAANRRDLSRLDTSDPSSGGGGFELRAMADIPIYADLNSADGLDLMGFDDDAAAIVTAAEVVSMRMSSGDDASCLNMQRPESPRVIGVPQRLIERNAFTFTKVREAKGAGDSPWELLNRDLPEGKDGTPVIPAIADAASAQWILKKGLGDRISVPGKGGNQLQLQLVGLLAPSIFASELLISDADYRTYFGSDGGYRYFLVDTPDGATQGVREALSANLGELGLSVERTSNVLASFARVQNTYLAAFSTLGGLGLLLGTFGVVTVLLRNVVERRHELAMLLALGLRRRTVAGILVLENGLLLILGVAIGTVAALVAVAPHLISTLADVDWLQLAFTLVGCLVVGLGACLLAAALSVRGELISALRSE